MKLQLNKKKLKNLSKDAQALPEDMTPNVAGGASWGCITHDNLMNCNATGSCGCVSDPRVEHCNTNTCY